MNEKTKPHRFDDPEYLAQISLLNEIMGDNSPQGCLSDKKLRASVLRLFKIDSSELQKLVFDLQAFRDSSK